MPSVSPQYSQYRIFKFGLCRALNENSPYIFTYLNTWFHVVVRLWDRGQILTVYSLWPLFALCFLTVAEIGSLSFLFLLPCLPLAVNSPHHRAAMNVTKKARMRERSGWGGHGKFTGPESGVHYQRPIHQPDGSQQFLVQMYLWFVIGYGFPSMSLRVQTISCSASLNYKCLMRGQFTLLMV